MRKQTSWNPHTLLVGIENGAATLENSSAISFFLSFLHLFIYLFIHSFIHSFIYLFIYGCFGSLLLHMGFLQLWRAWATTLHCGARASHCGGFSCCGAQALGMWASVVVVHGLQQLRHTGLVAPWHVGSSWTRSQTCVPCIGRWILNHCATREAPAIS